MANVPCMFNSRTSFHELTAAYPSLLCLCCRRVNRFRGSNTGLLALARRREELKRSEVAARENKVTLFRKYRTGELPDIQRVSCREHSWGPSVDFLHACLCALI